MDEVIINLDGIIDQWGYMTSNIRWQLYDAKGKKVRCIVNSRGGDVAQAVTISHLFAEHGDVVVELIGFTASAATFIGFGAKSIEAHEDGLWLMHKCSMDLNLYETLNSDGLQQVIDDLTKAKNNADAIDTMIAQKYLKRCKTASNLKDILDLMEQERWMPTSEVMELGFIDKIIPGDSVTDELRNMAFHNCVDLKLPSLPEFKNKAPENEKEKETKSVIREILAALTNFFSNKTEGLENPTNTGNDHTQPNFMNKKFTFVNQILKIEGVADTNGSLTLTFEQLQAIEDSLSANAEAIKTANSATQAEKDKFSNCLASLDSISDSVKKAATFDDKVALIKSITDKIPGVQPTVNPDGGKADKFANCRVDEINSSDY